MTREISKHEIETKLKGTYSYTVIGIRKDGVVATVALEIETYEEAEKAVEEFMITARECGFHKQMLGYAIQKAETISINIHSAKERNRTYNS